MTRSCRTRWLSLTAVAAAACGGPLGAGETQFNGGRYPEAKQTFAAMEAESRSYDNARRAEYALYRGLTLLALGDRGQAATWLREARAIEETRPDSLSRENAMRLKEGLATADAP